jgi:hypothetical protein
MRVWSVLVFFAVLALVSSGCKSKVTKANLDKIAVGMSLKEVEAILGEGKQQGDGSGVALQVGIDLSAPRRGGNTQVFVWESDTATITLDFAEDKVKTISSKGL